MTVEDEMRQARELGLDWIEFHHALVPSDPQAVSAFRKRLDHYELRVSMLTAAPDFTHPDSGERQRQLEDMFLKTEVAREIGALCIRGTVGCVHDGLSLDQGARNSSECLKRLAEHAAPQGVTVVTENHYRDRRWSREDFGFRTEGFLAVFELIRDTPVMVNYDFSNQIMTGGDPVQVLEIVKHKIAHCHANDRRQGEYTHSLLGEGEVDLEAIFKILRQVDYAGPISYEDGNLLGDEGTRRGFTLLREMVGRHW
jgi:sugar phosphate isomerase/epimerase